MSPGWVGGDGLTVAVGLEGGGGGVTGAGFDLAVEASVVEPVDVGKGGELDVLESSCPVSRFVMSRVKEGP